MTARERTLTILLGITGIIAAGAIALAANAISGREIGLSAEPVSLATKAPQPRPAPAVRDDRREAEPGDDRGAAEDSASGSVGPSPSSGPSGEAGEGNGGASGNTGPGSGTSGGGGSASTTTSNSGPGGGGGGGDESSGGSSGSGSSGPG